MNKLKFKILIHIPEGVRIVAAFDIASEAIRYANDYVNVWKCCYMTVNKADDNEEIHKVKRNRPDVN